MSKVRTSIKRHKNIFIFLTIIFLFGIISGILFYFNQDIGMRKTILLNMGDLFSHNVFDIKNLFIHLGILLIVIAASFIFFAPILLLFAFFFEGITIGFIIPVFFSMYKWKFFYTFGLYFILVKLIYIFLLAYLFYTLISFSKEYFSYLKTKKVRFFSSLKKMFILCIFVVINDLTIYFIFNKLLILLLG